MKYRVTMKVSYMTIAFLFNDRQDALDFMDNAWSHRDTSGDISIKGSPSLTIVDEEEEES